MIARTILERDPKKVAVNVSDVSAQADGMTNISGMNCMRVWATGFVPDSRMAIRWLETRTQRELELYPEIYRIASDILREAYSDAITPPE